MDDWKDGRQGILHSPFHLSSCIVNIMDIGRVIGTMVATQKDPSLQGMRLLIVQTLDHNEKEVGRPLIAVDIDYYAGHGDLVYMVTGGDAVNVSSKGPMPVDVAIVGVIDSYTLSEEKKREKAQNS